MTETSKASRHRFITLARRRHRPGQGSGQAVLEARTARMKWPDLGAALGDLPWAVCGAVATRLYMPERATADLDIVVRHQHAESVRRRLVAAGYTLEGERSIGGSTWKSAEGTHLDVIESPEPWVGEALVAAQSNRDAQGLPILPLPFLVLSKLAASRAQDLADLTRMLGAARDDQLRLVRRTVEQYSPADREDLESLIELGKLEQG